MDPKDLYKVVKICLFGNSGGSAIFVNGVATLKEKIGQEMRTWMEVHKRYTNQFLTNTQVFLDIHKQELEAAGLRVRISGA